MKKQSGIGKRIGASILCLSLGMSCLTACGSSTEETGEAVNTSEATELSVSEASATGHGSTQGKEETVYVIADAAGQGTKTIVSTWLKNPEEQTTLVDSANLTDIENVKGEETYTVDGDGNLVWQANGSDIYYQGISDQDLPIDVNITYTLDGKECAPEMLAGADGHLQITFSYENHTAATRDVDGEDVTLYQPFLILSGLILDGDCCTDISVTNGTVLETGSTSIVMGMAVPGLSESLGLADADEPIALPEEVVVEADVTDFSLLTTLTVVTNSLLDSIDLSGDDALENLKASLSELTDGTEALQEGAAALFAGTEELQEGAEMIDTNMQTLYEGLVSLDDGAWAIDEAIGTMESQVSALPAGIAALQSGVQTLTGALASTDSSSLMGGLASIESGAKQISAGLVSNDAENPGIYEGAGSIADGAGSIVTAAGAISSYATSAATSAASLASSLQETAGNDNNDLSLSALSDDSTTLQTDLAVIKTYAAVISSGAAQMKTAATTIQAGAQTMASGANQIAAGAATIESGINSMVSGNDLNALMNGFATLSESGQALLDGLSQLKAAQDTLASGADTAMDGAGALADGTGSLYEGILTLRDGTGELSDGMDTLADGIHAMTDALEEDGEALISRLRALQEYADEYTSFSGNAETMPGTVKFIIRTASIGE